VEKWISVRAQIILDEQGSPVRVIGVAMDVTERRRYEDRLRLTARELQHRVKNSLAVVQSIAAQSFRGSRSKEEGIAVFTGRLHALASATDLLTNGNWEAVPVIEIVEEIVTPFNDQIQITARGSELRIPSGVAVNLGMALHELSTNAVKYGALSVATGRVDISWVLSPNGMVLDWQESGGPPVSAPAKTGFGTSLLSRGLFADGTGKVELSFNPGGVSCRIMVRSVSGPSAM
jgi:two-component sensor histidine kinase